MKDIERRATELANTQSDNNVFSLIRHAYIKGACDQREIERERAVNWLSDNQFVGNEVEDGWLNKSYIENFEKYINERVH